MARTGSCKRTLHDLKNGLDFCFLSCNGLHDQKHYFGNLLGKHFGADGMWKLSPEFSDFFPRTFPLKSRRFGSQSLTWCPDNSAGYAAQPGAYIQQDDPFQSRCAMWLGEPPPVQQFGCACWLQSMEFTAMLQKEGAKMVSKKWPKPEKMVTRKSPKKNEKMCLLPFCCRLKFTPSPGKSTRQCWLCLWSVLLKFTQSVVCHMSVLGTRST